MSFVLEALKRSEHQRQIATTPTLGSYVLPARRTQSVPTLWIAGGVLLAALAAAAGWWMGTRKPTDTPVTPVAAPVVKPAPPAMAAIEVKPVENPAFATPAIREAVPRALSPGPSRREGGELRRAPTAEPKANRDAATNGASAVSAHPGTTEPAAATATRPALPLTIALPSLVKAQESAKAETAASNGEPVAYAELPASVKQALPSLNLGGYAVGADGHALIAVNDQLLHEGDEAAPGLLVDKILPDGVIFRYRQYRFRR